MSWEVFKCLSLLRHDRSAIANRTLLRSVRFTRLRPQVIVRWENFGTVEAHTAWTVCTKCSCTAPSPSLILRKSAPPQRRRRYGMGITLHLPRGTAENCEKNQPGQPITEPGFESGALEHKAGALSTRSRRPVMLILLLTNKIYHQAVSKSEMVAKCHEVWHRPRFRPAPICVLQCLDPLDVRTDQSRW
jgi:hypothetical protein